MGEGCLNPSMVLHPKPAPRTAPARAVLPDRGIGGALFLFLFFLQSFLMSRPEISPARFERAGIIKAA